MSSLVALRNELAAGLSAELAGAPASLGTVNISTHEGEFTIESLKACARKTPHVAIAFVRAQPEVQGGAIQATVSTVLAVITENKPGLHRDVAALYLVGELLRVLPRKIWETSGASAPQNMEARNMFTQNHALKGVNLWAIAYTQTVDLEPGSETLDDLITVASTWDLYPRDDGADLGDEPEATDTQTLEGAG